MEEVDKAKQFLRVSYGTGIGNGNSNGYVTGNGYGNGNSNGNGYVTGDGTGNGNSYGNGYGYGYGYGNSNSNGNGNSTGHGDGIKTYDGQAVYVVDDTKTLIESVHGSYVKGYILNGDLTLTPCYIAKRGNFFAHGETLAEAVRDAESKYAQNLPTEERIRLFVEAHPTDQPDTRYPAKDLYEWHHTLTGSCDAGRRAFAKEHDIDLTSTTLTVEEFISLTRNAYGGDVIKQLAEHYAHPTKN